MPINSLREGAFFGRIGNADLVRGISEILHIAKEIEGNQVSVARYEQLSQQPKNLLDIYYWFNDEQCLGIGKLLKEITQTSELVLDEYEKVESIRQQSAKSMNEAVNRQKTLMSLTLPESWNDIQQFVDGLNALSAQRGHLISLREFRYMDLTKLAQMEEEITQAQQYVSQTTATFLASDKALQPFKTQLSQFEEQMESAQNSAQLDIPMNGMEKMSADLDMLSNLMASLKFDDVTQQTNIIDAISQIYAQLNQSRARLQQKRKSQSAVETVAQFGAQFRLFSQGITNALSLSTDPERCDDQLSRLLVQLEELESQFSSHDEFLEDILAKREELLETFESHKQALLDERQRRSQNLQTAADRLLDSLQRRTARLQSQDELNAFFCV
ncbi:DNA repair ATPase [Providencia stuartii]|nr:DNA repair ATPase [Providencia stuartii]